MNAHVIDTNVLLVASVAHPPSHFHDSTVPVAEQRKIFEWLAAFRADDSRQLVLDDLMRIYGEYRHQLTEQDYGLQVMHEKMQSVRLVTLEWEDGDTAVVPDSFAAFDRSDRKLLAAALTDPASISIVNAVDTDWLEIEAPLRQAGLTIVHIVEDWLRQKKESRS
jgi:hypothetical protein